MTAPEPVDPDALERRAASVARLFLDRVAAAPDATAYRFPAPGSANAPGPVTEWESVTWTQVADRARRIAAGLVELGVAPQDRIAIASATSYQWALIDMSVMFTAAATTTVYPTSVASEVAHIVANSESRVVFAEDDAQLAKLDRATLPQVLRVVTWHGSADGDWVISLDELERIGQARLDREPNVIDDRVAAIQPNDLATLIYTSGTTGIPRGARLTHAAWTSLARGVDELGILLPDDIQYLWLPLSHVFGKALLTLALPTGLITVIDGRVDRIVDNLAVVQPTFMGAAPRIFEKAYAKVRDTAHAEGRLKARVFDWAILVGRKGSQARQRRKRPSPWLAARLAVADKLVFSTIRDRFGGHLRFFISGSAALNQHVAEWFDALGMPILEGYGLSETSAASFVNRPWDNRLGTVGPPIPGIWVRIADDGEVLVRGTSVMQGYHNDPAGTAEVFEPDGWFHTGDLGELVDGYLRLTDRKKDVLKTSNGKYVAPAAIDTLFKGICPYVSQLVVGGEGRPYVTALVALDVEAILEWASAHDMGDRSIAEIARADATRELIDGYIDELNLQLNRWEQIKKFTILERDLSIEDGEITPSLKLRRKVVLDKYRTQFDALYPAQAVRIAHEEQQHHA
ncbi:MAG: long-chain fatty acid--CoA ligase [Actinomycetia bacterium]|nr:long-chain fatty acid--CoA ligase [Actinomycetes bacterium]